LQESAAEKSGVIYSRPARMQICPCTYTEQKEAKERETLSRPPAESAYAAHANKAASFISLPHTRDVDA